MKIELGDKVKDTITGFTGIVTTITHWLNGCTRIGVQPETLKDGIPIESCVFDEPQVKVIEKGAVPSAWSAKEEDANPPDKIGGPCLRPKRDKDPR